MATARKGRAAQVRAVREKGVLLGRVAQLRGDRAARVRAARVRAAQVRAARARAGQVKAVQVKVAQVRAGQVRPVQPVTVHRVKARVAQERAVRAKVVRSAAASLILCKRLSVLPILVRGAILARAARARVVPSTRVLLRRAAA